MQHVSFHIAGVFAPTLFLMLSAISPNSRAFMPYSESFGAGDYLLEVYFKSNPQGPLRDAEGAPSGFDGYFVNQGKEEKISGFVRQKKGLRTYVFNSSLGRFTGMLSHQNGRCEPQMKFSIETSGNEAPRSGALNAAFCL